MKSIITISRQYGSVGRFVAEKLAERLGVPFYDNKIITMAAKKSGYAESIFENAEQTTTHSLLYSLSMFGSTAGVYGLPLSDKVYIIQSDVIKKIAAEGPCVIVGRCADYVLREQKNVINVFLHSDIEDRVARAVKYYGLDPEKAESEIRKTDKKRAAYFGYYTGETWGEGDRYDISLKTDAIGVDKCVDILVDFINAKDSEAK